MVATADRSVSVPMTLNDLERRGARVHFFRGSPSLRSYRLTENDQIRQDSTRQNHIFGISDPYLALIWPASRDPISKFWDPLIIFERIKLSASNLVQTYMHAFIHVTYMHAFPKVGISRE